MSESGAASVALDAASNARRGNDADRATNGHDNAQQQQQQQQNVQPEQSKPFQSRVDSQQTPGSTSAGFRSYASGGAPTSAPGSQDSTFSSGGGSVVGQGGRLTAGSRTLSVATSDTALTSPASASSQQQQQQYPGRVDKLAQEWSPRKTTMAAPGRVERQRVRTPEEQATGNTGAEGREANTATSPLGAISPSTRHKRTASGLVKSASTISPVYGAGGSPGREKRAESVSSSGSRAGEAAIQLKTRLAYAMAKVQHGWQNHNLDQVEVLAASLTPRTNLSSPAAGGSMPRRHFVSPRAALSTGASRLGVQDPARQISYSSPQARDSPPSKRRSGAGIVSWAGSDTIIPSSKPQQHHSQPQLHRRANGKTGPSLAPAADIRPLASTPSHPLHRRSLSNISSKSDGSISRPSLLRNNSTDEAVGKLYPGSQPQTPRSKARVVGALQSTNVTTAQAEQDAMDALMLMGGSPSGKQKSSNNFYPSSSSQPVLTNIDTGARLTNGVLLPASQPSAHALRRPSASQTSSLQPSPLRSGFLADGSSGKTPARAVSIVSSSGDAGEGDSLDGGESEDSVPDSQGSAIREAREKVLDEVEEMAS